MYLKTEKSQLITQFVGFLFQIFTPEPLLLVLDLAASNKPGFHDFRVQIKNWKANEDLSHLNSHEKYSTATSRLRWTRTSVRDSPKPNQFRSTPFAQAEHLPTIILSPGCQTNDTCKRQEMTCKLPVDALKCFTKAAGRQIWEGQTYRPTDCYLTVPSLRRILLHSSLLRSRRVGHTTGIFPSPLCSPRARPGWKGTEMQSARGHHLSISQADECKLRCLLTTPPTRSLPFQLQLLCWHVLPCRNPAALQGHGLLILPSSDPPAEPFSWVSHLLLKPFFFFFTPKRSPNRCSPVSSLPLCTEHLL